MKTNLKILVPIIVLILVAVTFVFISICRETTSNELMTFTLNFIIENEIGGTTEYINSSGQPWVDEPPKMNLLIYGPKSNHPHFPVNTEEPIKVWKYAENILVAVADKKGAIEEYRNKYMSDPKSYIWAWGYYDFAILSISPDYQEATIYIGASCGPVCGHGVIYTLQRNNGKWEIIKDEQTWIS